MKEKSDGFTLVELLTVMSILTIIIAIAVPSINHLIKQSEINSCQFSVEEISRHYQRHLILSKSVQSEALFDSFIIGQVDGDTAEHLYDYENDSVKCHIHGTISSTNSEEDDQQDDGSIEVPWF
jgi:prepilin-type N-terminal cleavage/methylation domain-containing protein